MLSQILGLTSYFIYTIGFSVFKFAEGDIFKGIGSICLKF